MAGEASEAHAVISSSRGPAASLFPAQELIVSQHPKRICLAAVIEISGAFYEHAGGYRYRRPATCHARSDEHRHGFHGRTVADARDSGQSSSGQGVTLAAKAFLCLASALPVIIPPRSACIGDTGRISGSIFAVAACAVF